MRKLMIVLCACAIIALIAGCGTQNEYLSKGKEWVKSDKRGRIAKAVAQFELAIEQEPDNAEAHYLLGYYDENATIERRAEQMVLAYKYDKKKYLKILIEETLRDRDENVRKSAMKALLDIHTQMDSIIRPLVKILKSKDSRDRDNAASVLSRLHNHREVVDRLLQEDILKHKRMGTRFDAVRALGNIGDPRAIEPLMERITVLKREGEEGEIPEVRRAAVTALRQIAKRDIVITDAQSPLLDIQVEPVEEGVRIAQDITGDLFNKTTLQKGEIISHVIDNKKVTSLEDFRVYVMESLEDNNVIFGLPKVVKVSISKIDELGIIQDELKPGPNGNGVVVGKLTIDSKAGKMGIEKGEIISYINDQQVNSLQDYNRVITSAIAGGEELRFTIANKDKYRLVSVPVSEESLVLEETTTGSARASTSSLQDVVDIHRLGMQVKALPASAEGVVITELRPRSPAIEAGLRVGEVISYVVIERKARTPGEYRQLLKEGLADGEATISVINKTAINKLIEILRNKGLMVRFDAAMALGEIKDKAAVDSLIEMLQEQANPIEIKL